MNRPMNNPWIVIVPLGFVVEYPAEKEVIGLS